MATFFRKLGLIGLAFFTANALAAIASLFIVFMRPRRALVPPGTERCPVCGENVPTAAKYCHACGSRL